MGRGVVPLSVSAQLVLRFGSWVQRKEEEGQKGKEKERGFSLLQESAMIYQ